MKSKWISLCIGVAAIASVVILYGQLNNYYYGQKPSLRIVQCTTPISTSGKLPEGTVVDSREDFVELIKSQQTNSESNLISNDLYLGGFVKNGEIDWSQVLDATKIRLTLFGKSYVLEYRPKPQSCMWATFSINDDSEHYAIYGCCGQIEKLKPGERRVGYGSFPIE